jgi:hypothetical protein
MKRRPWIYSSYISETLIFIYFVHIIINHVLYLSLTISYNWRSMCFMYQDWHSYRNLRVLIRYRVLSILMICLYNCMKWRGRRLGPKGSRKEKDCRIVVNKKIKKLPYFPCLSIGNGLLFFLWQAWLLELSISGSFFDIIFKYFWIFMQKILYLYTLQL